MIIEWEKIEEKDVLLLSDTYLAALLLSNEFIELRGTRKKERRNLTDAKASGSVTLFLLTSTKGREYMKTRLDEIFSGKGTLSTIRESLEKLKKLVREEKEVTFNDKR